MAKARNNAIFEASLKSFQPKGLGLFPALVDVLPDASKAVKIPVGNSPSTFFCHQELSLAVFRKIIESKPQ